MKVIQTKAMEFWSKHYKLVRSVLTAWASIGVILLITGGAYEMLNISRPELLNQVIWAVAILPVMAIFVPLALATVLGLFLGIVSVPFLMVGAAIYGVKHRGTAAARRVSLVFKVTAATFVIGAVMFAVIATYYLTRDVYTIADVIAKAGLASLIVSAMGFWGGVGLQATFEDDALKLPLIAR